MLLSRFSFQDLVEIAGEKITVTTTPLKSFWMGGFECTDQLNSSGDRVDLINTTCHLDKLAEDYDRLLSFGIKSVREGLRWSQVEKQPYQYDFTVVQMMLEQGELSGIQQIWDICHFGFPDDLTPLHPKFCERFVGVCTAFVQFYMLHYPNHDLIVTPINEVSFLSWLGGDVAGTAPYCQGNGWNVKYALMKAYIQAIIAMRAIKPDILILTTEPLVNIVPPLNYTEEHAEQANKLHQEQYQALDILTGTICPELGGSPGLIDILGFNYYYNNQWELGFSAFLPWQNEIYDARWRPFSELITEAYQRYRKPVILTETSHPREDRPLWIKFIAEQTIEILRNDIPFIGICLYPIIDRPDWDDLTNWHHSGLWDKPDDIIDNSQRILNIPYANELVKAQKLIKEFQYKYDNSTDKLCCFLRGETD